ncbi:MAG: hypothetical protein NTZ17_20850, partial [Phycisphaerae bacterium]|nr:hypothetical protein [Phycisphaerae bacterium]
MSDGSLRVQGGATLTMADGAVIENAGTMALEGSWIPGESLHGVVEADKAAAALTIYAGTGGMVNTGTLRAVDGGTLELRDGTFTNSGALMEAQDGSTVFFSSATATGGTVQAEGTGQIFVYGSEIDGAPVTLWGPGQLLLYNGSILGGAVGNLGGGAVQVLGGDNRLSGPLTNAVGGQVVVSGGATLTMADGAVIENAGTMALEGSWIPGESLLARLEVEGDLTLRGGGVMELRGTYP